MGKQTIGEGERILRAHGLPNYPVPERAVNALAAMVRQKQWQERPMPQLERFEVDREAVARCSSRSRSMAASPSATPKHVRSRQPMAFPSQIVLGQDRRRSRQGRRGDRLPRGDENHLADILHKTDIGGVKLNLQSADGVRDTFDLMMYRAQRYQPTAEIWGCLVQQQVKGGKEILLA